MRKAYISSTLLEDDLPTRDPIELFEKWFNTIKDAGLMYEPNAVALATTTKTGLPSCRMVLLKGCGPDGFVFFTNYKSRKGNELEENPNASMLFYWDKHHRQVRVEGVVEKTSATVSDNYFHSRPRESQISAVVSEQSRVVESRKHLEEKHQMLQEKYKGADTVIPRPSEWGGFTLKPKRMEFWQGHSSRLHDRIVFTKLEDDAALPHMARHASNGWIMQRYAP
ncbi:pyridoxine-5'-phosphate oxidase-like isoform X2 [Ornithodoros turicata]